MLRIVLRHTSIVDENIPQAKEFPETFVSVRLIKLYGKAVLVFVEKALLIYQIF